MTSRNDQRDHPIRRRFARIVRRTCLALFLLLLIFTCAVRIRSYVLCRRIQAVLSGLSQLEIDKTTEDQLLRTVPSLIHSGTDHPDGATVERYYYVRISNESEIAWLLRLPTLAFLSAPRSIESGDKWAMMDVPHKVAYCLGWRYISFGVGVTLRDGKVSRIGYGLETDVQLGWPASYVVTLDTVHALWALHGTPWISSMADEGPQYYIAASEISLAVTFAADAPRHLTAHAFQLDLTCYWGIRGCHNAQDVAPLLWQDHENIRAATLARLRSNAPCPDRVLAGRTRYLPDLNVAVLEVVRVRREDISLEGDTTERITVDYRLKDALRGTPAGPWTFGPKLTIPLPGSYTEQMRNPIDPSNFKAGDAVLYFSGARFDSCRAVPATPSAISAIRHTTPAPKLNEDEASRFYRGDQ